MWLNRVIWGTDKTEWLKRLNRAIWGEDKTEWLKRGRTTSSPNLGEGDAARCTSLSRDNVPTGFLHTKTKLHACPPSAFFLVTCNYLCTLWTLLLAYVLIVAGFWCALGNAITEFLLLTLLNKIPFCLFTWFYDVVAAVFWSVFCPTSTVRCTLCYSALSYRTQRSYVNEALTPFLV